jgi:ribonuclease-3
LYPFLRYKSKEDKALAAFVHQQFGYWPKRIDCYRQAFIHKSHLRDDPDAHERSNERLEFLGDAILDSVVAEYLYASYPKETEGFLTKLKSKIVKRETLNMLGEKLKLETQVRHTQFGINNPKSLLGNAFEALIGAIYLDKGFAFTREIILKRIITPYVDVRALESTETDYKSRIIIWSQRERKRVEFVLVKEENLGAEMLYEIELRVDHASVSLASARTKKEAEQAASRLAWASLFNEELS